MAAQYLAFGAAAAVMWALGLQGAAAASCPLQMSQNFNQYTTQSLSYTQQLMTQDFARVAGPFRQLGPEGTSRISDGALYGFFPAGKILDTNSGFSWSSDLEAPLRQATMEYDVYFAPNFDWARGGKLPGLCGGDCPIGCKALNPTSGWSMRLMWLANGAMSTYAYYPDKPVVIKCGEDWTWSQAITAGEWNTVKIYVGMNTPGIADGVFRAYINGKMVLNMTNVPYTQQTAPEYGITRVYMTTYAGGSDVELFAPNHDQWIKFDNIRVWEGDCDGPDGGMVRFESPAPEDPATTTEPPASEPVVDGPAPKSVGDYLLYNNFGGWAFIPPINTLASFSWPEADLVTKIVQCSQQCAITPACDVFIVNDLSCELYPFTEQQPVYIGATVDNVYLYVRNVTVSA